MLGTLAAVQAKSDASIVPEVELRKIPVQMPLGAMLVSATACRALKTLN